MAILKNDPEFRAFRTSFSKNLTPAEARLWNRLKGSKLDGRKFRRQYGVGKYVVAFYCPAERLGVELDGRDNFSESVAQEDNKRRRFIEALEIRVIRFEGNLIFENPEFVVEEIKANFGWRRQEGMLPGESGTRPSTGSEEVRSTCKSVSPTTHSFS